MTQHHRVWIFWAALNVAGIALIASPDSDDRVFSFSETHGPAAADLVGSLLLLFGWFLLDAWTWRRRHLIRSLPPGRKFWYFIAPLVAGVGLVAWSISNDAGTWWLLGAAIAGAVQVGAALVAGSHAQNAGSWDGSA